MKTAPRMVVHPPRRHLRKGKLRHLEEFLLPRSPVVAEQEPDGQAAGEFRRPGQASVHGVEAVLVISRGSGKDIGGGKLPPPFRGQRLPDVRRQLVPDLRHPRGLGIVRFPHSLEEA